MRNSRPARSAVLLCSVAAVILGGCAATPGVPTVPSPPASQGPSAVAPPPTGTSLGRLGIRNGPRQFTLPNAARPQFIIDNPNVVTLTFAPTNTQQLVLRVRAELSRLGFVIEADRNDSLLFGSPEWTGSFTADPQIAALTFRRVP